MAAPVAMLLHFLCRFASDETFDFYVPVIAFIFITCCDVFFRLNFYWFGLKPYAYHVTNVMLHCATTFLFCFVLESVIKASKAKSLAAGIAH